MPLSLLGKHITNFNLGMSKLNFFCMSQSFVFTKGLTLIPSKMLVNPPPFHVVSVYDELLSLQ